MTLRGEGFLFSGRPEKRFRDTREERSCGCGCAGMGVGVLGRKFPYGMGSDFAKRLRVSALYENRIAVRRALFALPL